MQHSWLILCLAVGGCVTTALPPRWQIGVPQANAADKYAAVIIRSDNPENSYTITACAITNNSYISPSDPAYVDIATNRWPSRRVNIDLSLDGGVTWPRRIGYMVNFDSARVRCDLAWSPPLDFSLLTTNAYVRATLPDGLDWPQRSPAKPYDLPIGTVPMAGPFTIGGAVITYPSGGVLWQGNQVNLQWTQVGSGPVMSLYWLTQTDAGMDITHWITTISNAVHGANSHVISLNVPVADQLELVLVSASDPRIHGYSHPFTVDP